MQIAKSLSTAVALLLALPSCTVYPDYDDRPTSYFSESDTGLTQPSYKSFQEAIYDERRKWEFCDEVDFGCIIDPSSRYTITIQLEDTAMVGRLGIYAGLKHGCGRELCSTNDVLWHTNLPSPSGEEVYEMDALLYPQAVFVWEREMSRLRK